MPQDLSRSGSLVQSPTAGAFLLVFEVELWETQRFMPVVGWGKKRLPTDRPEWADGHGKYPTTREAITNRIPAECEWVSDWHPHQVEGLVDKEGWSYAVDFPSKDYHATSHLVDVVRRRIWRRAGRVKHQYEEQPVEVDAWFSKYLINHAGDDSFEEVEYSDVHSLERRDRMTRARSSTQKRNTTGQCSKCHKHFSFLHPGLGCADCANLYCKSCLTADDATKAYVCQSCVERSVAVLEIERETENELREQERSVRMFRISLEQAILLFPDGETSARASIESMEFGEFRDMVQTEKEDKENILKNFEEVRRKRLEREMAAARQNKLDEWSSMRGPRQASIKLLVKSASNVPINLSTSMLSISSSLRVSVRTEDKVYHSHRAEVRHSPEFDFTSYFAVSDDTKPILITVEEVRDGVLEHIDGGRPIVVAPLNVRNPHLGIERNVSDQLVYTESATASLCCLDGATGERLPPSVTVSVSWTLEAREVECVEFCDNCGHLMSRCDCSPEVLKKYREEQAQAAAKRHAEIYAAREARLEEDRQARAVELQRIENEQRAAFLQLALALEVEEEQKRAEVESSEFQSYHICLEERDNDHHNVVQLQTKKLQTRAMLKAHVATMVDERLAVKTAFFSEWRLFAEQQREKRKVTEAAEARAKEKMEHDAAILQKEQNAKKAVKFALEAEQQEAEERLASAQRAEGAYKKSRQRKAQQAQQPIGVDGSSKAAVVQQQKKDADGKCCLLM